MKKLFPLNQVMGYVSSLVLSIVALTVLYFDMSFGMQMTVLLVCAIIQMSLQLFVFMHIGENGTKLSLYTNIGYALFVGLVTVFGTLFTMIWGYQ